VEGASTIIGFTPSMLWVFIGVAIAIGIIVKLVLDLIIAYREYKNPKMAGEKTVQEKLKNDHERLTKLEETTEKQDGELKLILRSQMAMIHHMIDGNNTVKLKEMQQDIEDFLITGKIKTRGD
jgi:hypothetical protein